jgi:hypothetical protein
MSGNLMGMGRGVSIEVRSIGTRSEIPLPRISQSIPENFGSHAWKFSPPWVLGIAVSKKEINPVVFVFVVGLLQRKSLSEKGTCFARGAGVRQSHSRTGGAIFLN